MHPEVEMREAWSGNIAHEHIMLRLSDMMPLVPFVNPPCRLVARTMSTFAQFQNNSRAERKTSQ